MQSFSVLYFADIVEALVKLGYKRGINIRGAPYDWRKAASLFITILHLIYLKHIKHLSNNELLNSVYKTENLLCCKFNCYPSS